LLPIAVFKTKLTQCIEAHKGGGEFSDARSGHFYWSGLHFRWRFFTYICSYSTPIDSLIGIPVRAMPYSFTASAATRFPAVADLLMVCDLAVHLTISLNGSPASTYWRNVCRPQSG
jgi:hypothetical protein